jgi:hypothetical protein
MDDDLTKVENYKFKMNSKTCFKNYNESDFPPIFGRTEPHLQQLSNHDNFSSPNLAFQSPKKIQPLVPMFQSPKNSFLSKKVPLMTPKSPNVLSLETEFMNPFQNEFQSRLLHSKMILKNIIRDFGVQFYLKVLDEYKQDHGLMNTYFDANSHIFNSPSNQINLKKRGFPATLSQNKYINSNLQKMDSSNNSFQIQKINLSSTKNDSLYSMLNGNLNCPNLLDENQKGLKRRRTITSIERNRSNDKNPKNILIRLYQVLCGDSPQKTWISHWDPMQTQIFWLILYKMGVLPDEWSTSLQKSSKFPISNQKLKSVSHKTNMLTNRILIKILNRFYYQARDKECAESEEVLRKLLKTGKANLIIKDFSHFSNIVGLNPAEAGSKRFIDISKIQNQYLNRKMKEVLCNVLVKQSQTSSFHAEVRNEVLTDKNKFQVYHKNKVFKKLRMAISKVENFFVEGGKLPKIGLNMNQKQKTVFKKLKIPPPLQNWVEAFDQVDDLLSLIPSED